MQLRRCGQVLPTVASIGDFDKDGVKDLAVGAYGQDDGGQETGAVWILLMNANGKVKTHSKISKTAGGFNGPLNNKDYFGNSVASIGDFDKDGVTDLAVGADGDDDGAAGKGAM